MWCDELGLDALVLEREAETGGQLLRVYNPVRNHLGVEAEDGRELRELFAAQVSDRDFDVWTQAEVESADLRAKRVRLANGEELRAVALVIATGVRRRTLGVPGESEFKGRGVLESGKLDGELVRGEDVCVVGGGDAAAENALMLAEVCTTVTLVHRGAKLRARSEFLERIQGDFRITVFTESTLERIIGRESVEAVEILRRDALKPFQMAVKGVLIRIGVEPNAELFAGQAERDESGYIKTDSVRETSVENVFAIGDIANPRAPTVSGAVGDGATVAKVIAARLRS